MGSAEWVDWMSHSMKQNTCAAFVFSSLSIFFYSLEIRMPQLQKWGRVCATLVFLIGAATVLEYILEVDFSIDQIFARDPSIHEVEIFPGRMAPNTALEFVLLGAALLMIDHRTRQERYPADYLLMLVAVIAGTALIGYLYQSKSLYQFSSYLRISEYSASLLITSVIAALLSRPEHPAPKLFFNTGAEGKVLRYVFPSAILFPIIILGTTVELREAEIVSRATGYALATISLVVVFSVLGWQSARAVAKSEKQRRKFFDQERMTWEMLNEIGRSLVAELDQEKLVQAVTDVATRLSGAQFGAFFYNSMDERGDVYQLYAISGVPREKFSGFPMPRPTEVFKPTFMASSIVRSADITKDERYGKMAPHYGMPKGHLPVRSYLAVPVVSRDGGAIGGLFFGHAEAGVFSEQSEKMVEGLALQAAVAMDNSRLYRELQQSVRTRDEFLSIASHELKTPLTTLKLQSQIRERFLAKGDTGKFSADYIAKMVQSDSNQINRIIRLVDDMLDIGRINSGKLTLNLESFDLSELCLEVIERSKPQYAASKVLLTFEGEKGLMVNADRHRIDQVLVNLLSNALKYGEGKPVAVRVLARGERAMVHVEDQGPGIDLKHHPAIFERFERGAAKKGISGLGLGLFIVKEIVESHNGNVVVQSEPGKGAKFIFDLQMET